MTVLSDLVRRQIGIPSQMSRATAEQLRDELVDLWRVTAQRPPADVLGDLDDLKAIFDPVVSGRKLRDRIVELPERSSVESSVPKQCRLRVGPVHSVVTPEGRVALELVDSALASGTGPTVEIDESQVAELVGELMTRYRDWGRHRINGVLRLLNGGKALQVQAIGGALTLLVNGSDRRDRAVGRVAGGRARDDIDSAFRAPSQAFSQAIAPSEKRAAEKERLVSGWTLHEVNRRRPGSLIIEEDVLFVKPGERDGLVRFLADELARPRRHVTEAILDDAFAALVKAYRESADTLAGFGMAYERPTDTEDLREQLLAEFRRASQ